MRNLKVFALPTPSLMRLNMHGVQSLLFPLPIGMHRACSCLLQ